MAQVQKPEETQITLILGQKDSGKTAFLRGLEEIEIIGFFPQYLALGMKILVIDTLDHIKYRDIPILELEDLHRWEKGVFRIILPADDMWMLYILLNTYDSLYNTFVIFEDAFKHCQTKVHKKLREFLIDSKQKNIEVVFMYHAWGWVPEDLYKMIQLIEVFKTGDSPKSKKDSMPGYYELALSTYKEVMADPSPYAHKLIETGL